VSSPDRLTSTHPHREASRNSVLPSSTVWRWFSSGPRRPSASVPAPDPDSPKALRARLTCKHNRRDASVGLDESPHHLPPPSGRAGIGKGPRGRGHVI
jgi:hypothetical protein